MIKVGWGEKKNKKILEIYAHEEFRLIKPLIEFIFCFFLILLCSGSIFGQVIGDMYNTGLDKSSKGDYYGAIADFTKVIEQYPNEPKPYHYRGINKFNLKDYEGAILDFDKAIKLNPKFTDAYYMRGMAKVGAKKKKDSCPDFEKAKELGHQAAQFALDKYCK
jgi:tetratricopeptide (TPR) repeat protein